MTIERMKSAYEYLYKMENILRNYIQDTLQVNYGSNWLIVAPKSLNYRLFKKNPSNYNYHETISLLAAYPCLSFNYKDSLLNKLEMIIPIRNKIAHCHLISQDELDFLINVYLSVLERCNININKRNRSGVINESY
jgi:hypothetical protein